MSPVWLNHMFSLQFTVMLVGADLFLISDMIKDPINQTYANKKMKVELNLCRSLVQYTERGVPPPLENLHDFYTRQQSLMLSEFRESTMFKESIMDDTSYIYRTTPTSYIESGQSETGLAETQVFIVDSVRFRLIHDALSPEEVHYGVLNHDANIYTMRPPNPASMAGLPRPLNYPGYINMAAVPCLNIFKTEHMFTHLSDSKVRYWPVMMYRRKQYRESLKAFIHNYSYNDDELMSEWDGWKESEYMY